ncbi:MAG: hypothetical protein WC250_02230 [Candidatus Paceibacterota bacterium]|jgi:hypothetical protein
MKNSQILKPALLHAFGAVAYIYLVATFMGNAEYILGPAQETLGGVLFLLLLVVSVATMGMLIFGRPILWYLDGQKKEAVSLAIATVLVLVLIGILVSVILILN